MCVVEGVSKHASKNKGGKLVVNTLLSKINRPYRHFVKIAARLISEDETETIKCGVQYKF